MPESKVPTTYSRAVAANVRQIRERNGWSQQELATKLSELGCELSHHDLSGVERGRNKHVSVDLLVALASALSVSTMDLITTPCTVCYGAPPSRFTCTECGRTGQ